MSLLIGAYAAHPPIPSFFASREAEVFHRGLEQISGVNGIELPLNGEHHASPGFGDLARLSELLPQDWDVAVTGLPAQMQTMERDPHFGLASLNEEGRARAIDAVILNWNRLRKLKTRRPDLELKLFEIHSGPRPSLGADGVAASIDALTNSVETLFSLVGDPDLFRRILVIEHCDAWRADRPVAKGFLSIEDEIRVAREMGFGILINWGRSVIDGRAVDTADVHLRLARKAGVLKALIFSGHASGHSLYGGTNDDSHAPFREGFDIEPSSLELTQALAQKALLESGAGIQVGLKMQPLPKEMAILERLAFLRRNVAILASACAENETFASRG